MSGGEEGDHPAALDSKGVQKSSISSSVLPRHGGNRNNINSDLPKTFHHKKKCYYQVTLEELCEEVRNEKCFGTKEVWNDFEIFLIN